MKVLKFNEVNSSEFDPKQLEMGIKIEMEHNDVWDDIASYCDGHNIDHPMSEKDFYERIAKAHLSEIPDYYSRLKVMEEDSSSKCPKCKESKGVSVESDGIWCPNCDTWTSTKD